MARSADEVNRIAAETVGALRRRLPVTAAYLFGSYAEGRATDDSDIDVAVFSPAVERMDLEQRVEVIVTVRFEVNAEVEIHLFPAAALDSARPTNIYGHILKTGKRLE